MNFFFLTLPLLYLVKSSPSKKRRTPPHGPLKKTAASGPFLSTQISSNSQHHLLQHQISSETKEEVEGENGKSWKQDVYFTPECKTIEQTCCWLIPAVFWLVPACTGLLPQHGINSFSSFPVIQSGHPDLLPKTSPPSNTVGKTSEITVAPALGKPGFAPSSQPPPQSQDDGRSVGVA